MNQIFKRKGLKIASHWIHFSHIEGLVCHTNISLIKSLYLIYVALLPNFLQLYVLLLFCPHCLT